MAPLHLSRTSFAMVVTVVYGILLAITMAHHELWRDEAQAWMISAASNSFADIFHNIRYEGHPPLWFLIIWPFTYFDNPDWIKVPHFLLAVATCYLILRYAPFPRWVTLLLVFGYFFFYEYGVISRNYQLGVLGIIGFLVFLPRAKHNPWWAVVFLAIAAMANIYSLIVSLVFGLYYLVQTFPALRHQSTKFKWHFALGGIVLLAIVGATAVSLKPPSNEGFSPIWYLQLDMERLSGVLNMFSRVYVPIPDDIRAFWNTTLFRTAWLPYCSVALLGLLALVLGRYPQYLIWFLLLVIGLLAFHYVKYLGHLRHGGHMWLAFIAIMWLLSTQIGWQQLAKPIKVVFILLLAAQLYAAGVATVKEIAYPFSGGKATAEFVEQAGFSNYRVIGHVDNAVSAFTAYYGKPVYYPVSRSNGTFVIWSDVRKFDKIGEYLQQEENTLRQQALHTIIVTHQSLWEYQWLNLVFDSGRCISGEQLHVYTIAPTDGTGS